jgi:hypothetical protein
VVAAMVVVVLVVVVLVVAALAAVALAAVAMAVVVEAMAEAVGGLVGQDTQDHVAGQEAVVQVAEAREEVAMVVEEVDWKVALTAEDGMGAGVMEADLQVAEWKEAAEKEAVELVEAGTGEVALVVVALEVVASGVVGLEAAVQGVVGSVVVV